MKVSKKLYYFIAANLAFLIPVPGRFAYAVIMMILFNIQIALTTLLFHAVHHLDLAHVRNVILSLTIIALGIFYKQMIVLVYPTAALTLGFCIFLPSLVSVIIEFFFLDYKRGLKAHIALNMRKSFVMTVFALLYFLFRDVIGYGTLTLPGWKKMVVLHLPLTEGPGVFFATIPGSIVLMSVLLSAYLFAARKIRIFSNAVLDEDGE